MAEGARASCLPYKVALIVHMLVEAGVGLALFIKPALTFPQIAALPKYSDPVRALLRWFCLSIILQGLVAFTTLREPPSRQRPIVRIFLSYHLLLVLDGVYALTVTGETDMDALGVHSVVGAIFVVAMLCAEMGKSKTR